MFKNIYKKIKLCFTELSKIAKLIEGVASIFTGLMALHFDWPAIDASCGGVLRFMAGVAVGFLLFGGVRWICCKFFDGNKQGHTPSFPEEGKPKRLWSRGSGGIFVCYDDLFSIAAKDTKDKKFVVIPVNTTFDTIVEDAGTQQQAPLVSPNTLHGMWIRRHGSFGLTLDEVEKQIERSLQSEKVVRSLLQEQKPRGNCREYSIGTIAAVEGTHNTIFLLAALSAFDEKNRAHAGEDDIITVIKNIVYYCDTYGQQAPVYLPVMGTGLSRTHLTKDQAFHVILDAIKSCENEVNEKYTIVIYPDDREASSIEGAVE